MQWITEWWGIEIGAETEGEVALLKRLKELLPEEAQHDYDQGRATLFTEDEYSIGAFGDRTFDSPMKYVLRLER